MSAHFKDLEGAGALVIKLSTGPVSRPTFVRDIDEISNPKVQFMVTPVYLLALILLGFLKVLPCKFNSIMSLLGELLCFLTR